MTACRNRFEPVCEIAGLPEKAQNKDGDDEGRQRHGVADGVPNPHRAEEFTVREILHREHTRMTRYRLHLKIVMK